MFIIDPNTTRVMLSREEVPHVHPLPEMDYSESNHGSTQSFHIKDGHDCGPEDRCELALGLGSPLSSSWNFSKEKTSVSCSSKSTLALHDNSELGLRLFIGRETMNEKNAQASHKHKTRFTTMDEGSTSAKRSGGYMPSLLSAPRTEISRFAMTEAQKLLLSETHLPFVSNILGAMSETSVSGSETRKQGHHPKKCRFRGCTKGARGASGLCIAHGGGQRCQKEGCYKGAEGWTVYCKSHGGGRRCQHLGCTKSAEGKTDYCIAHGGGKRCGHPGCTKASRGKSGLCIRHGGGKRCTIEGCSRSAEGQDGLCISHGGGRRCEYSDCTKGAQGRTMYCKAHGGGKRCVYPDCTKGAEGSTTLCKGHGGGKRCLFDGGSKCPKSVHGGTDYCIAHGGGKRCLVLGCTKSARGRTDFCVQHGGGKRCKVENCGKSAQGRTDFCKGHGGGKRCIFEDGKCKKFARGKSSFCPLHENTDQDVHIDMGMPRSSYLPRSSMDHDFLSVSSSTSSRERGRTQKLVSTQVCLSSLETPSSTETTSIDREERRKTSNHGDRNTTVGFQIPEGRVHGGGLLSLFGGNLTNADVEEV